ncbi:MAG: trypsin-like peptidase domain-containing protein [Thermoleophilia bacterium]|nr:trypsin-like peptidase domain-containing protein [Thermoleophilia bacterium]
MAPTLPPLSPRPPRPEGLPPLGERPRTEGGALPPLDPRPPGPRGLPPRPAAGPPAPAIPRRGRRRGIGGGAVAGLVAMALVAGGAAGAVVATVLDDDPTAPRVPATPDRPAQPGLPLQDAISSVEPSVVQVRVAGGQGSGVVTAPRGLIVTNEHVVSGERRVVVVTADRRRIGAEVVRADARSDLAILRPDAAAGPGAVLAPEPDANLRSGDTVFAIGSPFGLLNTVTVGVVSSVNRRGSRGQPVIQTDAPINPGNSGGGLFDLRGRLVGVPTSIDSPIRGNVGIGFAVPVERVRTMLDAVP